MPIGKTVEMWAVCDCCEKIVSYEPRCSGNVRTLAADVRAKGWTVKSTGEAICPECKNERKDVHAKDT